MQFINPVEILDLQQSPLIDIDDETVRQRKKKVLARIDLSDDGLYDYKGLQITRSDCAKAIDELDDINRRAYFWYLVSSNAALNDYLTLGDESKLADVVTDGIFVEDGFMRMVGPYVAYNLDRSLAKALKENNSDHFHALLKLSAFVNDFDAVTAFKSTGHELQARIAELDRIKVAIKEKSSEYNASNASTILDLVKRSFPLSLVNSLPKHFDGQLEDIAESINFLQLAIWDNFDIVDVPFGMLEHLLQINIESASKEVFEENYKLAKRKHQDRVAQAENAPLLKKWNTLLKFIQDAAQKVEAKTMKPVEALNALKVSLNVEELNAVPEFGNEVRSQIAIAVRNLSLNAWNEQNDVKTSLEAIRMALAIDIAPETKERLRKDETELLALQEKFKGIYTCHFCEKNAPDNGSKLHKTIYKENSRSVFPRKVQYSYIEAEIPRCQSCADIHSKGNQKYWLFTVVFALIGLLAGAMIDEHFIIGGLVGLGLGLFLGHTMEKNTAAEAGIKLASDENLKSHPLLQQKIREGWTFSKPTA